MRWPQAKPDNVQSISSVFVKTDEQVAQGEICIVMKVMFSFPRIT